MVYLPTFTTHINYMQVNIPYMDPMGYSLASQKALPWASATIKIMVDPISMIQTLM